MRLSFVGTPNRAHHVHVAFRACEIYIDAISHATNIYRMWSAISDAVTWDDVRTARLAIKHWIKQRSMFAFRPRVWRASNHAVAQCMSLAPNK